MMPPGDLEQVIRATLAIEMASGEPVDLDRLVRVLRARIVARDRQLEAAYAPVRTRAQLVEELEAERRLPVPARPTGPVEDSPLLLAQRRAWLETMHESGEMLDD